MQTSMRAAVSWPNISFGPVNLWSLQPVWKGVESFPPRPHAPAKKAIASTMRRDNPLLLQASAHR